MLRQRRGGVGWARACEGVAHHATPAREARHDNRAPTTTKKRRAAAATTTKSRRHFALTFEEDEDLVCVAYGCPYTQPDLHRELRRRPGARGGSGDGRGVSPPPPALARESLLQPLGRQREGLADHHGPFGPEPASSRPGEIKVLLMMRLDGAVAGSFAASALVVVGVFARRRPTKPAARPLCLQGRAHAQPGRRLVRQLPLIPGRCGDWR